MKNFVFLAHWSLAFIEEQFFALFLQFRQHCKDNCIYFCEWNNKIAVEHLIYNLFDQTTQTVDFSLYPKFDAENQQKHVLEACTIQNTIFVVYFPPPSLPFFLRSTGNRFPRNFIWWQVEQSTNDALIKDGLYRQTIAKSRAIFEFSRCNHLIEKHLYKYFTPFSRDVEQLSYDICKTDSHRLQNICQHQKFRLLNDNNFTNPPSKFVANKSVLLLGTCETVRRNEFRQICEKENLQIVCPNRHNYVFGVERQQFISEFVKNCDNCASVSVNIHQYNDSVLEQAKIYLLLACGVDFVVSEKSRSALEDAQMQSACNGQLIFVDSLENMCTLSLALCKKQKPEKRTLQNPASFHRHYKKLTEQVSEFFFDMQL